MDEIDDPVVPTPLHALNAPRKIDPASCPVTRPTSPLGGILKPLPASMPASRRGSFQRSRRDLPPMPPRAPADALLRRTFTATFGATPTGRGELKPSTDCPVHAYESSELSEGRRRGPAAHFGTAGSGRGLVSHTDSRVKLPPLQQPLLGPEATQAQLPHSFHATIGTARTEPRPRNPCDVHAYLDHAAAVPFKHSFSATIGSGKPLRPRSGCKVHSYLDATIPQPKHSFHATFGSGPRFPNRPQPLGLPMQPVSAAA